MGVDLATYRARIGTFISRRNVTCDDERRRNASAKRRWKGRNVSKALSTTNLKHMHMAKETSSSTHSLKMQIYTYCTAHEFGLLSLSLPHVRSFGDNGLDGFEKVCFPMEVEGSHRTVHLCVRAKLSVVMTSFGSIKQRLLILSGDVEMNPGPLGQHTDENTFTPKNILAALKDVVDWKSLGVQLDIGLAKLHEIAVNNQSQVGPCKIDMISFWLSSDKACSWEKLVDALKTINHLQLAEGIRTQYCPLYQDPSQESLPKSGEGSSSSLNKNTRGQSDKGRGDEIGVKKGDDFQNVSGKQLDEDDLVDVMEEVIDVAAQWRSLGLALRLKNAELDTISSKNHTDPKQCLTDILSAWLQQHYDIKKYGLPSWMMLCQAISKQAGGNNPALARKIAENHIAGAEHNPTPPIMPPAELYPRRIAVISFDDVKGTTCWKILLLIVSLLISLSIIVNYGDNSYTIKLKNFYRNSTPDHVDDSPVPKVSFTNLALIKATTTTENQINPNFYTTTHGSVDDIIETKEIITYKDLLNNLSSKNRLLLLEGRPGCGKTTLTLKITKDWTEKAILIFVRYLFLIPLRQLYATPITGLDSILNRDQLNVSDLENEITGNAGKEACFIFDGLDEYSNYSFAGRSWFERLLRGEVLTSSIIIITSRPHASAQLRKYKYTRVEILGFLKEDIDQYINKSYPTNSSKASEVKKYLHDHQNIQHMCYLPLHLVMIIFILQKDIESRPKTETDIYKFFTEQHFSRCYGKTDLQSLELSELPLYQNVCKLAYYATVVSKTSTLIQHDINVSCSDILHLGIIVVDKKQELYKWEFRISFLHLTIQEYLAACYLNTLPPDEQLKAIREHFGEPHMGVVLKFFCGITRLQNIEHWTEIIDNALNMKNYSYVNLRALQCVFESQNGQMCSDLFSKANGTLWINDKTLSMLDYFVIGYCLELASDAVKSISFHCQLTQCQLTSEGLKIIVQNLPKTMNSVTQLRIWDDLCDNDKLFALNELFHRLHNLEILDLSSCFNKKGWIDWTWLGDLLNENPHLKRLDLGRNNLGPNGLKAVCAARASLSNLTDLDLSDCFMEKGLYNWTLLGDLLEKTPHLVKLDLRWNNLGPNGMQALYKARDSLSNLTDLNLYYSFTEEGSYNWTLLGDLLKKTPHLEKLDLGMNNLGPDGLRALWAARANLSNLIYLNLHGCFIFMEEESYNWTLLGDLLKETPHLVELDLGDNHLGPKGLKALYEARTSLSNLRHLNLDASSYNWTLLGSILEHLKTLKILSLSHQYLHLTNESRQLLIQKAKNGGMDDLRRPWDMDDFLQPGIGLGIHVNHSTPNTTDDPPTPYTTATP